MIMVTGSCDSSQEVHCLYMRYVGKCLHGRLQHCIMLHKNISINCLFRKSWLPSPRGYGAEISAHICIMGAAHNMPVIYYGRSRRKHTDVSGVNSECNCKSVLC